MMLPTLRSRPTNVVPSSSLATAMVRFFVESGVYGSQFEMMLNHAYRHGIRARPKTQTIATTLLLSRLISERMMAKTFEVLSFILFIALLSFRRVLFVLAGRCFFIVVILEASGFIVVFRRAAAYRLAYRLGSRIGAGGAFGDLRLFAAALFDPCYHFS